MIFAVSNTYSCVRTVTSRLHILGYTCYQAFLLSLTYRDDLDILDRSNSGKDIVEQRVSDP